MSQKFVFINADGFPQEAIAYETSDYVNASTGETDAGKPIVLDADGHIDASMINDGDIDHGSLDGLSDDDHTQYTLADGTRDFTGIVQYSSHPTFVDDTDIVDKKYVDDILLQSEWYPYSALDYVVDNTLAPASENLGDVYVLSHDGGAPHADYDGASAGDIVKFDGDVWVATTPTTGERIGVDNESSVAFYLFGGVSWTPKYEESTTASTGLTKVGFDIQMASSAAGDGLAFNTGVLSVNATNGVEVVSDNVQLDLLASGGLKLVGVEVGVEPNDFAGEGLIDDGSDNLAIDWSTAFNDSKAIKASDLSSNLTGYGASIIGVEDPNSYFTATDVEGVLSELYEFAEHYKGVEYLVGTGGVTIGHLVYVSANDTVLPYSNISQSHRGIGLALTTQSATETVMVTSNDTVIPGVLSGATAGTPYYWNGTALTTTIPGTPNSHVWQVGVAKNATDLHVEVRFIKVNH